MDTGKDLLLRRSTARPGICQGMTVVLAIVLLACLGRFHPTLMVAAAPAASGNVEIAIHDFYFDPQTVTVSVGTNVAWNNLGAFTHTADSDTGIWDSGDIPSGGAYSRTFDTAGTFAYHCDFHPSMKGIVVVMHRLCLPTILRRAQPQ